MAAIDGKITMSTCEGRPCWVGGRRAIFHRWTDSARPVKPVDNSQDTDERLQKWSVHGLVEYEDGAVEREWPSRIRFADSAEKFDSMAWEQMEARRDAMDGQEITPPMYPFIDPEPAEEIQEANGPELNDPCKGCAHEHDNEEYCKTINFECEKCTVMGCVCKNCHGQNREPKGGAV